MHGGKGYCSEGEKTPLLLSEKELCQTQFKSDIWKRLKEIIYVLGNTDPKLMSMNQRLKPTFSNHLMKMLGRFGKPVDLIAESSGEDPKVDVFTVNELTTTQLAERIGTKIVRKSEIVKVIGAVEAYSLLQTADECSHVVSALCGLVIFEDVCCVVSFLTTFQM